MSNRLDMFTLSLLLSLGFPAMAQTVNGELGSAGATMTIPGNALPPPPMTFGGKIGDTAEQSKPWWARRTLRSTECLGQSCIAAVLTRG
jgi:hypothetical protein